MNICPRKGSCRCQCCPEIFVSRKLRLGLQAATEFLKLIREKKDLSNANAGGLDHRAAIGLAMRIVDSFSDSMSMLGCKDLAVGGLRERKSSSLPCGGRKWHKPRKGANSWTEVTSAVAADGYAWRKYGQKLILNAKHPRSYFKCTNKPHCQALKRVQKMDDVDGGQLMYKTTHIGHHTCENEIPPNPSSFSNMGSSVFVRFEEENNEQSISSKRPEPSVDSKNQQSGFAPSCDLPSMENIDTFTSPKNVQWSLDDYDHIIGSLDFNDF